jgi:hypothetical protein
MFTRSQNIIQLPDFNTPDSCRFKVILEKSQVNPKAV